MSGLGTASERGTARRPTAVLLVARLDRRVLPALRFVAHLPQTEIRALHLAVDPAETRRLAGEWIGLGLSWLPLHIRDPADGSFLSAVRRMIGEEAEERGDLIVVLPEMDYRWWHLPLHRRSARRIARALQPFRNVSTVIVPYFLGPGDTVPVPAPYQRVSLPPP